MRRFDHTAISNLNAKLAACKVSPTELHGVLSSIGLTISEPTVRKLLNEKDPIKPKTTLQVFLALEKYFNAATDGKTGE